MINWYLSDQLQWIRTIQEIRNPVLDYFFYFMNFFDSKYLILVILPLILVGWHWKHGFRLMLLLFISSVFVFFLKELFNVPRPYTIDPSVGLLQVPGQSFPSGAAQTSIILPGFFIYFYPKRWVMIWGIVFALLLSFSRLYLGVHYPLDLLGGWIVGTGILMSYIMWGKRIERFLEKRSYKQLLWISFVFFLLFILLFPYPYVVSNSCALMGVGMGLIISKQKKWLLSQPADKKEFFIRTLLSISVVLSLYFLIFPIIKMIATPFIAQILPALILGFSLSVGCFYLLKRCWHY